MQKLQFEPSWEKTVSIKDRNRIEQAFSDAKFTKNDLVHLSPLWQAVNHKGQLLVTVLIHNTSQQVLTFHNKGMRYLENDEMITEHLFTLPSLIIVPQTSTPWTFIFPVESLTNTVRLKNGHLEIS